MTWPRGLSRTVEEGTLGQFGIELGISQKFSRLAAHSALCTDLVLIAHKTHCGIPSVFLDIVVLSAMWSLLLVRYSFLCVGTSHSVSLDLAAMACFCWYLAIEYETPPAVFIRMPVTFMTPVLTPPKKKKPRAVAATPWTDNNFVCSWDWVAVSCNTALSTFSKLSCCLILD